jgi:hypothetical protein
MDIVRSVVIKEFDGIRYRLATFFEVKLWERNRTDPQWLGQPLYEIDGELWIRV